MMTRPATTHSHRHTVPHGEEEVAGDTVEDAEEEEEADSVPGFEQGQ